MFKSLFHNRGDLIDFVLKQTFQTPSLNGSLCRIFAIHLFAALQENLDSAYAMRDELLPANLAVRIFIG